MSEKKFQYDGWLSVLNFSERLGGPAWNIEIERLPNHMQESGADELESEALDFIASQGFEITDRL